MGKHTGFIEFERELPTSEPVDQRIQKYAEFEMEFPQEKTAQQASRCMDCGVPFCHSACPLGNKIPDFNDAVYRNEWEEAYHILKSTNNFPEFTGRICPAPCEGSCVLGINHPSVTIEHIEKSIAEKAFEMGWEEVRKPKVQTGKHVAIVGSGPAGLAAADLLNQKGHSITVFERDEHPGGLLRFGIPDFKLDKEIVSRRIDLLEKEGITFKTNTHAGVDIKGKDLLNNYDAILLSGGSTIPRDLSLPGRDLRGVHFAMEFLTQQNREVSGSKAVRKVSARGRKVVVIGGGDTGSDCVGTSIRQGAESVLQIELLGKPPMNRSATNPWPEWPMILRTSSSHEEGCERDWAILTKEFVGASGKLTGLKVVDVTFKDGKLIEKADSERIIPADLALIAAGFIHPQKEGLLEQLNVAFDERGNVQTSDFKVNATKVFAAGDMRRGQSLVVWAIAEGRQAASAMDQFLMS